ncbi:hypothetical protein INP83_08335 [Mucilaginibacter sp. 21P]|uniref:hypothetical protein n=1 Tax=Mucilaginibacter sp. 21P TaxID=2778902 RepID=UPI001C5854B9|nr:hypothetical protein [Mucilaginibacter sp. 21P]QXV67075.1 hypothetical protein INP83_08335 [Mucilaginibacter sp. 21P]
MKNKPRFKLSNIIVSTLLTILFAGIFLANIAMKNVYEKIDKNDPYWNYTPVFEQPYKHLKIEGGNITQIIFQPSKKYSLRVLNDWQEYEKDVTFKTFVKDDTLHLIFPNKYKTLNERDWMSRTVLVRLFAPQLLSVDGNNTNFEIEKLKQANITINLRGKSHLEVESDNRRFDTVNISQADSSQVMFEMSPETKGSKSMQFGYVNAQLKDYTILDIGRGYANKLNLDIADSAAIILSGKSVKAMHK